MTGAFQVSIMQLGDLLVVSYYTHKLHGLLWCK